MVSHRTSSATTRSNSTNSCSTTEPSKDMHFDDANASPASTQQHKEQRGSAVFRKQPGEASMPVRIPNILPSFKTISVPLAIFLVLTNLVVPVASMDNQISLATYPVQNTHGGHMANQNSQLPLRLPFLAIGTMSFVAVGYMATLASHMLGPLMGITSVLWFIMRNDTAVRPSFSWSMFAIWFVATLTYLNYQARRVTLDKLYILITLMFSGLCLCTVALVQKGSIQGGLVTAIPPCMSFAAYAVTFLFPDRREPLQESVV